MRSVVVGYGVTGRAVAAWLLQRGDDVVVFDDRADDGLAAGAATGGITIEATPTGGRLASRLRGAGLLVPSPGVPVSHPVYAAAAEAGVPVRSEIELASEVCQDSANTRLIAVTGTNGKTTVTTLVTAILERSGFRAVAAGNIGVPLIEAVYGDHQFVVAEVSSFQLEYTDRFRPSVSCWLNLAPDHLDWHPDMGHYASAKAKIWSRQGPGDRAVFNADDPMVATRASETPAGVARISYSTEGPALFSISGNDLTGPGGDPFMAISELPRALPHDVSNSLAAAAVALSAGATPEACRDALRSTAPLPHRVALVGSADGVDWYDDSKATTPASVLAACRGFPSVVLIAGGRNKGLDLSVLASAVPPVRAVVGIGEAAAEVEAALAGSVTTVTAASMEEAVERAASLARPGDAVLLSPGCASFDWYRSYSERGDDFARIVTHTITQGDTAPC
ncbi:MAG TPA: UDP-N-acetylmuramoyl-L-alanine--D-glutamate ligase [Acidimicrobiales bacterium]|jgi:UDP-N-acetylmuramoylalanine--D-glutamate ligase|nr:UDP-N-acetylmuramoyl-L-alanine--D-glutamate ligase [Acidimicrobiales bacterium]